MTAPARSGLEVQGATVRYGGSLALEDVSLRARADAITGLIGPNGAGKTTLFNACSGLVSLAGGSISLDGRNIGDLPPYRRAQHGLGRTYQRMELFESLTVAGNVALAREALHAGGNPLRHARARSTEAADVASAVADALELCGLSRLADVPVAALSTGHRRLVELARTVAAGHNFLLLDEPSSGLDPAETTRFGEVLLHLVSARDVGILLVEHDMDLVMSICEHLFVLDFGRLLCDGSPAEISHSDVVRRAYLGEEVG